MTSIRLMRILAISLLVFGMAGIMSVMAAEGFYPGAGSDPYFFSPNWKPVKITYSFSDPDFFSSDWKPAKITYSYSDPDFFISNWTGKSLYTPVADPDFNSAYWNVPTYKPAGDPDFLYSNWSVKAPVLYRYSGIESSRINSLHLDPFASDSELEEQGWEVTNTLW